MFKSLYRTAACIGLLWSFTSIALAGSFTPAAGSTISTPSVTIVWESDASEQWVRAYSSSLVKLYDSGRLNASTGSETFTIGSDLIQLRVIFYEKNSSGAWIPNDRTYAVDIGGDTGGGDTGGGDTSGDTLASLNCANGQVAKYNGTAWQCATDDNSDTLSDLNCSDNQIAVSDSSGSWSCAAVPTTPDELDVVAAIEAMFCVGVDEVLHLSLNGELRCGVVCPYQQELTASGLTTDFRDPLGNGFFLTDDSPDNCQAENDGPLSSASLTYENSLPGWQLSIYPGPFADEDEVALQEQLNRDEASACAVLLGCTELFEVMVKKE